jgi:hypothetical protein
MDGRMLKWYLKNEEEILKIVKEGVEELNKREGERKELVGEVDENGEVVGKKRIYEFVEKYG